MKTSVTPNPVINPKSLPQKRLFNFVLPAGRIQIALKSPGLLERSPFSIPLPKLCARRALEAKKCLLVLRFIHTGVGLADVSRINLFSFPSLWSDFGVLLLWVAGRNMCDSTDTVTRGFTRKAAPCEPQEHTVWTWVLGPSLHPHTASRRCCHGIPSTMRRTPCLCTAALPEILLHLQVPLQCQIHPPTKPVTTLWFTCALTEHKAAS